MKKILNTKIKDMNAITLIALVITIVVLIILAAIAINLSLGNNGIFNRAKTAKEQYQNAEEYEYDNLSQSKNQIDSYIDGYRGGSQINYSAEEQNTGLKWLDNKPIYQKTLTLTNVPTGINTYSHNISNLYEIVSMNGATQRAYGDWNPIPTTITLDSIPSWGICIRDINTTTFSFRVGSNYTGTYAITKAYITFQYTKTTD